MRTVLLFGSVAATALALTIVACSSDDDASAPSDGDSGVTSDALSENDAPLPTGDGSASDDFTSVTQVAAGEGIIVEKVSYVSDGFTIYGQVCRPDDSVKHPLVLLNHGGFAGLGSELYAGTLDDAANFCFGAAKNGFVVAESSYRGEDGSQGKIEVCNGEVDDVLALLAILRKKPWIDPVRVGALGGSHGGCISDRVALRDPTLKVVVEEFGPTDFVKLYDYYVDALDAGEKEPFCVNPDGGTSDCVAIHQTLLSIITTATGGTPDTVPAEYAKRSTITDLPNLKVPIIIFQGTDDPLVTVEQACEKRAALSGIPTYYYDTSLALGNPATPCGGNYLTSPTPSDGGYTKADWPSDRYLFVYQGQGHGFTGAAGAQISTQALDYLISRL
ncbi:MAG TPA: prolyl oligopeptidase family serine peptidase [Polyangiaceae bacterium]